MGAARLRRVRGRSTSGRFAGWAGVLHPLEWPEPELAYSLDQPILGPWHRHRGGARRARLGLCAARLSTRLASFIRPDNARSMRVAEKLGAVREGMVELRGSQAEWWVHRT